MPNKVYVCTETFWANLDGTPQLFRRDITLVSEDDNVYKQFPGNFKLAESKFRDDVESATQAPGEKRRIKL
jgi:hypothetical protein